jgi:nicotinamidase-related amidase
MFAAISVVFCGASGPFDDYCYAVTGRKHAKGNTMRRLDPKECALIVIDVQERLAAAMPAPQLAELTRAATILIEACELLGARVIATEQYPNGLGSTIPALHEPLARINAPILSKLDFSACDSPAFERAWAAARARTAVVCGMEAHVCVFQTVRELVARGADVHVALDGVASRRDDHRAAGLELCRAAGATITTMETVVFDWLQRAGSDSFKKLSKRIR